MKLSKTLSLLLISLTLVSCGTRNGNKDSSETTNNETSTQVTETVTPSETQSTSETTVPPVETTTPVETETTPSNPEIAPGITQFDLEYAGYEGKDNYYATKQGYGFDGVLGDFGADSWLVAGIAKPFNVSYNKQYIDFVVKIEDETVLKYEVKEISGNPTHTLTGLKTGTTKLKIYDADENIIYRQTVNVRVKINNAELIFKKIASADYWKGVGYGMATGNNYRLFVEENPKNGLLNICTMTLVTAGPEAGVYKYEILDSTMQEVHFSSFDMFTFDIKMITNEGGIIPLKFDVAQSLSTIIVSDKQGAIDMFRPIYLD